MIHPSYVELMKVVNEGVEIGEEPVVNSRYSLVIAAAKRARSSPEMSRWQIKSPARSRYPLPWKNFMRAR